MRLLTSKRQAAHSYGSADHSRKEANKRKFDYTNGRVENLLTIRPMSDKVARYYRLKSISACNGY
jgi:hypothetical protein